MVRFPALCKNHVVPINGKLALPFSRKNVFCLCFQRKINFVGSQGLDFLNYFHSLLPSRDPISQKRKPWNLVIWPELFCRSSSHHYSCYTNVHLAALLESCFHYSHLSFKMRWKYRADICASLKAKQKPKFRQWNVLNTAAETSERKFASYLEINMSVLRSRQITLWFPAPHLRIFTKSLTFILLFQMMIGQI